MDPSYEAPSLQSLTHPATGPDGDPARVRAEAVLSRLPAGLHQRVRWLLDRWPGRIILQGAAGLARIEVFDRAMTIAAQFFSSVLPVLILIATLGSNSDGFAEAIDMPEQSRQVLEGAVEGGGSAFGIVGAVFVLVSATSLSRALARAFASIWGLPRPPTGLGSAWRWLAVVLVLALSLIIVRAASQPLQVLPPRELWPRLASFSWDVAVAAFVPWALLAGMVRARMLVPGALLFALLMITVRPATQAWLPGALESSADRYGSIGVAFTYLTWLYVASFCFLATALLGQVIATDHGTLGRRVRGLATSHRPRDESRRRRAYVPAEPAIPEENPMSTATERTAVPASVTTPSSVETSMGVLDFNDGYPTAETAEKLRDHLDYVHGLEAFMNSIQGVSTYALREGFLSAGVMDGDVVIFSELMDSRSLLLTANADTVYFCAFFDLSGGPLVLETPSDTLGIVDDMWFRWVTDFGLPGADRGQGGTYLLVGPGYDGPLPEGGHYVRRSRTNRVLMLGRAFIDMNPGNDPGPTADRIKEQLKVSFYTPGGLGSSIGDYLTSGGPLGAPHSSASPRFVEGTGLPLQTVPPNDFGHYEFLDALVQMEGPEALDVELAGQFAAIGIVKDEKFAPDGRMRRILDHAVAAGNAASRTLGMGAHPTDDFRYYDSGTWWNMLWPGGFDFTNPPPEVTPDGLQTFPDRGARQLHSRTSFFYTATGITPAMCMRLTNIGSQYLMANVDANGDQFDGGKTYRVTLPNDIPAARFWSFTVYDNQTRSMLQTDQGYPRAGSQSFPSPAAEPEPDGSTVVHFSPTRPDGVAEGNWIQTDPDRGWFVALRLYSPLQSFFDKSWRAGEIEQVG